MLFSGNGGPGGAEREMAAEVIYEFQVIGACVRVTAISSESLTEVTVLAPASTARHDLLRLAERKLRAAEARADADQPKDTTSHGLLV